MAKISQHILIIQLSHKVDNVDKSSDTSDDSLPERTIIVWWSFGGIRSAGISNLLSFQSISDVASKRPRTENALFKYLLESYNDFVQTCSPEFRLSCEKQGAHT